MNDFKLGQELVEKSKNIIISGHFNPDGDALGTSLGLMWALRKMGKNAHVCYTDNVPKELSYLPGYNEIVAWENLSFTPDLYIIVDCSAASRIEKQGIEYFNSTPLLIFDHHIIEEEVKAVNYIDSSAAAVAQVVYKFIKYMNIELDKTIATCIYSAIVSDTCGFLYSNTSPETMEIGSELLKYDINQDEVKYYLFDLKSEKTMKMMALSFLHMEQKGEISWTYITNEDREKYGATVNDCDHLVPYTLNLEGSQIGLYFEEHKEENIVKASLRARGDIYNVCQIAKIFGGGGHKKAAGFRTEGELFDIMAKTIAECEKMVAASKNN